MSTGSRTRLLPWYRFLQLNIRHNKIFINHHPPPQFNFFLSFAPFFPSFFLLFSLFQLFLLFSISSFLISSLLLKCLHYPPSSPLRWEGPRAEMQNFIHPCLKYIYANLGQNFRDSYATPTAHRSRLCWPLPWNGQPWNKHYQTACATNPDLSRPWEILQIKMY